METYYMKYFNPEIIKPVLVSLVPGRSAEPQYDSSIDYLSLDEDNKFEHLVQILKNADIVQFQGSFDPLVCEAARVAQVPMVVEVLHNIEKGGRFKEIDLTVCVSDAVVAVQDDSSVFATIHNGIDPDEFAFPASRKRAINNEEKIIFLQAGNRSKLSVHLDDIASELARHHKNIEFWIAGREQNRTSTDLVKFFGVHDSVSELYQAADYLVFFSPNESFGLVAIEAMSCGCIPILSADPPFTEIVTNGHDGFLLDQTSHESAIHLLSSIISGHASERTNHIRKNARATVEQRFSISACIKKYEELYCKHFTACNALKIHEHHTAPIHRDATGDAIIGECIFAFHTGDTASVFKCLRKITDRKLVISHPLCIDTALDLFQFTWLNNQVDLACDFILHILSCTPEIAAVAVHKWFSVLRHNVTDDRYIDMFENSFITHTVSDRQLGLQHTESLLLNGSVEQAKKFLARASKKSSSVSNELSNYYSDWLDKIGSLQIQHNGKQ
jgi:glycosyltransferase involved in cell wall biosynthesis